MSVLRPSVGAASAIDFVDGCGELRDDGFRPGSERACHIDELDGAELALAFLVLGDERLRLSQLGRHLSLGQSRLAAQATKQSAKLVLGRRAQGVAHCGRPKWLSPAFPTNPSSGLSQFRIPFIRVEEPAAAGPEGAA